MYIQLTPPIMINKIIPSVSILTFDEKVNILTACSNPIKSPKFLSLDEYTFSKYIRFHFNGTRDKVNVEPYPLTESCARTGWSRVFFCYCHSAIVFES